VEGQSWSKIDNFAKMHLGKNAIIFTLLNKSFGRARFGLLDRVF
jgi:hypothetical protein